MRKLYFSIGATFLISFFFCFSVFAVNTAQIDVVRSKEILADSDTEVIEDFLAEVFSEFFAKTDFSDIASLRTAIVSRSSSELDSGQFQYGSRFFTAAQKEISNTFKKISDLPESDHKTLLATNLLIIINDLGNIELSKAAFDYLQNSDVMIRYWAVSCLTNNNILHQLDTTGSSENSQFAEQFAQKLQTVAQSEQSGDILILLGQFASGLKQPAANEILKEIAQKRINLYLSWQVENETVDSWILKALSDKAQIDPENASIMAKNFATLYSLVIQRYIIGQEVLSPGNIRNLVSVIAQAEKCLSQFLPDWQNSLKRAIEKGGGSILLAEHDSLFGSANTVGKLPAAANFDYGKNPDGSVKTAPPTLQKPPQAEKSAETEPEKPTETKTKKQAKDQSEEQPENNK
jgi:flagellin-specific chaperone FliS